MLSIETAFMKFKSGNLTDEHTVLLHLWKWEQTDATVQDPIAWTLFHKHAPYDEKPTEKIDGTLFLRETVWDMGNDLKRIKNTVAGMKSSQPTLDVREMALEDLDPDELIAPVSGMAIPLIGLRKWTYAEAANSYGISIPDYATDGMMLLWKNDGPAEWQAVINWARGVMTELAKKLEAVEVGY